MNVSTDQCGWAFDVIARGIKKVCPYVNITGRSYPRDKTFQIGHIKPPYPDLTTVLFTSYQHIDVGFSCRVAASYNPLLRDQIIGYGYYPYQVPQCIDYEYFPVKRSSGSNFRIGFIGNARRDIKRFDLYLQVKELLPQFEFKQIIQKESLTGELSYGELNSFYKDLDLILCTSSYDIGPGCCFEGGLCATPSLICSKNVGFTAVAKENYEYFSCHDDPLAIRDKILFLANNRELIDMVGTNCHNLMMNKHTFQINKNIWDFVLSL